MIPTDTLSRWAVAALLVFTAACGSTATVTAPVSTAPASTQAPAAVAAQPTLDPDTVRAGRFDQGKMWTFENPPLDYLAETYGFRPDAAWFERARLGTLRLPGCSGAFVSPHGLVATNHHCARGAIVNVSREGEDLLAGGFLARSLDAERKADNMYLDQLVAIGDVTDEVEAALRGVEGDAERAAARQAAVDAIEARLLAERGGPDADHVVQVVSLYDGGRFSAYTFRRYRDVRLVAAPEAQLGHFGGDADNFTYPRYSLDFALLRAYGPDSRPLDTPNYFTLSREGVQEGDLVFVIGNPGSTNRLETVAQLTWRRDVQVPGMLRFLQSRIAALTDYLEAFPSDNAARVQYLSLSNALKAYTGRRAALADPYILARRGAAERDFVAAIAADPALQAAYGDLVDRMAAVQQDKMALGVDYRGLGMVLSPGFSSATLRRATLAHRIRQGGDATAELEAAFHGVQERPEGLEVRLLAAQVDELRQYFADTGAPLPDVLQGGTPREAAERILAASVFDDGTAAANALTAGNLEDDPALRIAAAVLPRADAFEAAYAGLVTRERELGSRLGRARFDIYGIDVPPDATFSPRFTDGVVKPYAYNGTVAPTHTTVFGLYDHYYSYGAGSAWDLPARWLSAPAVFDRSTPLNFISTSDTIGGNSGSPALDRDLRLVGLNFDRTIEGLVRDYIYLPDRGRNVMVDARAILEVLDDLYDLDRAVLELTTGRLYESEADADAVQ